MVDLTDVWRHVPDFGFGTPQERDAKAQYTAKLVSDHARIKEAELEKARINAGAPASHRDAEFEFRKPRDVLRKVIPQPYSFDDVPLSIGTFAFHYAQATGHDPSGIIVSAVTAAASVIDDGYKLVVKPESHWTVSARQWSFLCGEPSTAKSPAIRAATAHIKYMHNVLFERWRDECEAREKGEPRPPLPALYTSDSTVPALADALVAKIFLLVVYFGMRFSNALLEVLPVSVVPGVPPVATVVAGKMPSLSLAYILSAMLICLQLLSESVRRPFLSAVVNTGIARPARMAMMEMTTSSSMSVKP